MKTKILGLTIIITILILISAMYTFATAACPSCVQLICDKDNVWCSTVTPEPFVISVPYPYPAPVDPYPAPVDPYPAPVDPYPAPVVQTLIPVVVPTRMYFVLTCDDLIRTSENNYIQHCVLKGSWK